MAKDVLALNIGSSTLTLASFSVDKKVTLEDYATVPLNVEPGDDNRSAYVLTALEEARDQIGAGNGPIHIAVPSKNVLARYIKLPAVADKKKMDAMVKFEASEIIPFPIDEVVWDYQTLGEKGIDDDETLILAIKQDQIKDLTDDLQANGLDTVTVDVAPLALFNNFNHNYAGMDGCTLILDIGAASTDLIFIEDGKFFTRSVGVAGNVISQQIGRELDLDFMTAEALKKEKAYVSMPDYEESDDPEAKIASKSSRSVMTKLHGEINRAINLYKGQQSGSAPDRILLTGGSSLLPQLDEFLAGKLGVEVEHLHTFAEIDIGKNLDEDDVVGDAVHLGEVIGLALRETGKTPVNINLMPQALIEGHAAKKRQGWFIGALALLLGALALWTLLNKVSGDKRSSYSKTLESEVNDRNKYNKDIKAKLAELEAINKRIEAIVPANDRRDRWIRLLSGISQEVPKTRGVWIHEITPVTGTIPEKVEEDPDDKKKAPGAAPAPVVGLPGFPGGFGAGATGGPQGVLKIRVTGLAYTDIVQETRDLSTLIGNLVQAKDPKTGALLFEPKPENARSPNPPSRDSATRSFGVDLVLADPIPIETEPLVVQQDGRR